MKMIKLLLLCLTLTTLVAVQASAFSNKENPEVKGTIVETMNSGGYTYVLLDSGNDMQTWVAITESEVKVGEEVTATGGMVMQNFTSDTLNRTFPVIIFASGLVR